MTEYTMIQIHEVTVRRINPDDPNSDFTAEINLEDLDSRSQVTLEWELAIEDPENTPVRTVENRVTSALEAVAETNGLRLPDDVPVLRQVLRTVLSSLGVEVLE